MRVSSAVGARIEASRGVECGEGEIFLFLSSERRVLVHFEVNGNWLRPLSGMHGSTGEFW